MKKLVDSDQKDERIKPLSSDAERALNYIIEAFKDVEKTDDYMAVGLQPGEAIIFNNGWGLEEIKGVMHGREGRISNPNRWLQRGFLHAQNEKDKQDIADGYFHSVSKAINDTDNFSIKDASSILRKAMLESNGCKEYKEKNPSASETENSLYGTQNTSEKQQNRSII